MAESKRKPGISTLAVGGRDDADPRTGALGVPIVQTSTFHQADPGHPGDFEYARGGNPTRQAAEQKVAELEGGGFGMCFGSGMAAITTVLSLLGQGDHVVASRDLYGGTHRALTSVFARFGVKTTFVDATDLDEFTAAFRANTRLVFLETPSNPLLKITDLRAATGIARQRGALSVVDNTFMTPVLQRPLDLGADVVVHSATKYLGGHGDLLAGCAVVRAATLAQELYFLQNALGGVLSPSDSWLLLRGIKTLPLRIEAQQRAAERMAGLLAERSDVGAVFYPGLEGHPGRSVHLGQSGGPGAVVSFDLGTQERARAVLSRVKIPAVGPSLGGVESILSWPWTMSHGSVPPEEKLRVGIGPGLLRYSTGLEDFDDLWTDLEMALG